MAQLITEHIAIGGMTCQNCERRIREMLLKLPGVKTAQVSYDKASATVEYDPEKTHSGTIRAAVEQLGYEVQTGSAAPRKSGTDAAGAALIILAAYLLLRHTGLLGYLNLFPTAEAGMDYSMLFLIGLMTSVHCIAMCGGINLSQCIPAGAGAANAKSALWPGLLYNGGRVISYTAIGALVGAIGSVFSFSGYAKGFIQLLAGVFMVLMGVNMLGLFPGLKRLVPRLPGKLGDLVQGRTRGKGPLFVGLLNGLMPCGPLQAMQLYALSTGHPLKGALSMLLFSLGTVPLMLGLSVFSASMSRKFTRRMMTAGAVLVVLLGVSMFQNGMALSGLRAGSAVAADGSQEQATVTGSGVQTVTTQLSPYGYEAITVEAGIPVEWTISAENGTITGCNNRLYIPEYGIEKQLQVGDNLIEFTPTQSGVFPYSCWMGMIRSSITVLEEGQLPEEAQSQSPVTPGMNRPQAPAVTYELAADGLAIARIEDGVQQVSIDLTGEGFTPAIVVVQFGVQTLWTIDNSLDDAGDSPLVDFPFYGIQLELVPGENSVLLEPYYDFDFWLSDGSYAGYVHVVDDLESFDQEDLLAELQGASLTYSPVSVSGLDSGASSGMSCCI